MKLSDGEWTLMKVLWDNPPKTITQMYAVLKDKTRWTKRNVITMLDRLEVKGAVCYVKTGKARQYWPLVEREDAARQETTRFVDRVFNGRMGMLLHTALDSESLTERDIDELSEILRKAKEDMHRD